MQLFKRLTACVLALVLCLGMLPTQTNAQENSDMDVSMGDDIHFRGTNGFGNLLGAEFQQTQEAEEASGDCGISDLAFEHPDRRPWSLRLLRQPFLKCPDDPRQSFHSPLRRLAPQEN